MATTDQQAEEADQEPPRVFEQSNARARLPIVYEGTAHGENVRLTVRREGQSELLVAETLGEECEECGHTDVSGIYPMGYDLPGRAVQDAAQLAEAFNLRRVGVEE